MGGARRVLTALRDPDKVYVKHFEDLCHPIPKHVLARFPEWADEHEVKPVDFSGDGVITDHYPFGKGEAPGGFSITADTCARWRWLAIGPGANYSRTASNVRECRHKEGDSLEYFRGEAAKIRVMRVARTCVAPALENPSEFKALVVGGGYNHPATAIVSHLQFAPGVTDLAEHIAGLDDPVRTLRSAMIANPFNAVFVVECFPALAGGPLRDGVLQCVWTLPMVAHRFPPDFLVMADVDGGKCGELTHMLPVDRLCKTIEDVKHLFFHDPVHLRPPLPWRWVRNTFGPDGVDRLVAKIRPEWLHWLPDNMHTPDRIDRWVDAVETMGWSKYRCAGLWTTWIPDAFHLDDARQFRRIVAATGGQLPSGMSFHCGDEWWTPVEVDAYLANHGSLSRVPEALLTHEALAKHIMRGNDYSDVPDHLRTPELDAVAVLEVANDYQRVRNYHSVASPTLEMSRVFARSYSAPKYIPAEHMADPEVVRGVCAHVSRYSDPVYPLFPEALWDVADAALATTEAGFRAIPADRMTDALARLAPIEVYDDLPEPVRTERKEEHDATVRAEQAKEEAQRMERLRIYGDENYDCCSDRSYSPPPTTAAEDMMADELGSFY